MSELLIKPETGTVADVLAEMHAVKEFDKDEDELHGDQGSNACGEVEDVTFLVVENVVNVVD